MKTLKLKAAAELLNMAPSTLRTKAKSKIIPGAKPSKEWVFVEDDLIAYLRSFYQNTYFRNESAVNPIDSKVNSKINLMPNNQYFKLLGLNGSSIIKKPQTSIRSYCKLAKPVK